MAVTGRVLLDELILNINDISVSSTALKDQRELTQSNPGLWQVRNQSPSASSRVPTNQLS